MTSRRASVEANAVSLFPFLAVLLCTMGSLLVLLVVLAQRATEQAEAGVRQPADAAASAPQSTPTPAPLAPSRVLDREEIRRRRDQLEQQLAEIETRIEAEKSRLGHLEDHNRRVEHDLAKLYVANEQLQAVENEQKIDQVQAEQELARLRDLLAAAEEDLETAREQYVEQPAKTLFVYRGPNGTTRPPVYIECTAEGVMLQPEGVTLAADDFPTPLRAGNALALAVRATQDYAVDRQRREGESLDTPYPLVIVRPGGRKQFNRVVRALTAADLQYGYEFLGADAVLEYSDPDPTLAEIQYHAVLQARSRQELLALAAPSRFGGSRRYGGGGGDRAESGGLGRGLGGGLGGNGHGVNGLPGGDDDEQIGGGNGPAGAGGAPADGAGLSGGSGGEAQSMRPGESGTGRAGALSSSSGSSGADSGSVAMSGHSAGESHGRGGDGTGSSSMGQAGADPDRYSQPTGQGQTAGGGGRGAATSSASGASGGSSAGGSASSSGGSSAGSPSGGQAQQNAAASNPQSQTNQLGLQAEANARGANWAVAPSQPGAVAMRRPIRVIVGRQQLAVLPSRHRLGGRGQSRVVSFDDPPREVLDQFSEAIRDHMQDWGLAGRGMHWRPVVILEAEENADAQARQLARALQRSGVDVQFPATADTRPGGPQRATR